MAGAAGLEQPPGILRPGGADEGCPVAGAGASNSHPASFTRAAPTRSGDRTANGTPATRLTSWALASTCWHAPIMETRPSGVPEGPECHLGGGPAHLGTGIRPTG